MDFRWENVIEAKGNMHFTGEQHPPGENVLAPLVAEAAGASTHRSRSSGGGGGDSHCVRRTPSFIERLSCYARPFGARAVMDELRCPRYDLCRDSDSSLGVTGQMRPSIKGVWSQSYWVAPSPPRCAEPRRHLPPSTLTEHCFNGKINVYFLEQ